MQQRCRNKFWVGLWSCELKMASRHKFDDAAYSYSELLAYTCSVELEVSSMGESQHKARPKLARQWWTASPRPLMQPPLVLLQWKLSSLCLIKWCLYLLHGKSGFSSTRQWVLSGQSCRPTGLMLWFQHHPNHGRQCISQLPARQIGG